MFYNTKQIINTTNLEYFYRTNLNVFYYKIVYWKIYKLSTFLTLKNKITTNNIYLKIKLKLHNKKHVYYDMFNLNNLTSFTNWRYTKLKKRTLSNPKSLILKNRRILRYFFNNTKISSTKLNTKLLPIYKFYSSSNKNNLYSCLGFVLLNTGFGFNISDVYYLLKTSYIKLNNKITKSFFTKLKPNDFITVDNLLFLTNFSLYYRLFTIKWLKRKRKKINTQVRKYINLNKSNTQPSKIINRWLSNVLFYSHLNINCEVDYRLGSLIYFYTSKYSLSSKLLLNFFNSFSILNLWHYKH